MKKIGFNACTVALLMCALIGLALAQTGGRPLYATLTGAAEVPGPGDPDGAGVFVVTLNQGQGEICYTLAVTGIDPARAAHIHRGTESEAGPVVVGLVPPTSGASSACLAVSPELIKAIRKNPENYYVNVHNAVYPAGAIRGQLSKHPE